MQKRKKKKYNLAVRQCNVRKCIDHGNGRIGIKIASEPLQKQNNRTTWTRNEVNLKILVIGDNIRIDAQKHPIVARHRFNSNGIVMQNTSRWSQKTIISKV